MNTELIEQFGSRVRIRCLALIKNNDSILLIKHRGLNRENCYWMPPGGGIDEGESVIDCVKREVKEEVNLNVLSSEFYYLSEFIADSLHAVELFFESKVTNHDATLGFDPEITRENQYIIELKWMDTAEICTLPDDLIHPVVKKYVTCEKQVQS
ncbi:MAG: NUDIX hydrolase [Spirosomaceae bacterium]|nr:NUDIX hydrolase [Spirosomataceae bacterium]